MTKKIGDFFVVRTVWTPEVGKFFKQIMENGFTAFWGFGDFNCKKFDWNQRR